MKITLPKANEEVIRKTFHFAIDKTKLKDAELRDGHYLLRTNLVAEDPAMLWDRYIQLTQIEAAFKCLKSDLAVRPIYLSIGAPRRCSYHGCLLGVLLDGHLEASVEGPCPRINAASGAG